MKCYNMDVTSNPVFLMYFGVQLVFYSESALAVVHQSLPISIEKYKPVNLKDHLCGDVMQLLVPFALI